MEFEVSLLIEFLVILLEQSETGRFTKTKADLCLFLVENREVVFHEIQSKNPVRYVCIHHYFDLVLLEQWILVNYEIIFLWQIVLLPCYRELEIRENIGVHVSKTYRDPHHLTHQAFALQLLNEFMHRILR